MTMQEGVSVSKAVADSEIEFERGTWRARGARAYNGALGPQRGPGAEPLVGGQGGEAPLKLKAFELSSIQWKRQKCLVFSTL